MLRFFYLYLVSPEGTENRCIYITLLSKSLYLSFAHSHTQMAADYHARFWPDQREQFGVQCLVQGHFNSGGAEDWTANPVISRRPQSAPFVFVIKRARSWAVYLIADLLTLLTPNCFTAWWIGASGFEVYKCFYVADRNIVYWFKTLW